MAFAVACTPKIGEQPEPPQAEAFGGTSCLGDSGRAFSDFFKGAGQDEAITNAWTCWSDVFVSFHRYVRGQNRDGYTSQELATFLEHNLLGASSTGRISPALQKEVMKFKQLFVGGSRTLITRQEILDLIDILKTLKGLSLRANPHMKVYLMKWNAREADGTSASREPYERAEAELQHIAATFASLIRKDYEAYGLTDLAGLVRELSVLMEFQDSTDMISKALNVGQTLKAALLGGDANSLAPRDWSPILKAVGTSYAQYLRYHYFIQDLPSDARSEQITEWAALGTKMLAEAERLLNTKESRTITRGEVDAVATSLAKNFPSIKSSPELISQILKVKRALLGGDLSSLKIAEVRAAREKVAPIEALLQRLVPSEKIYFLTWDPTKIRRREALRLFEEARSSLDLSGRELGALMVSDYDSYDLGKLLTEVDRLYRPGGTLGSSLTEYLPLFNEVKNAIYEDGDSIVRVHQWSNALGFASRVFTTYLFNRYFISTGGESGWTIDKFDSMDRIITKVAHIVGDMLLVKKPVGFNLQEITGVCRELQKIWPAFKTSAPFISEVMKVKRVLLGGSTTHFTHKDYQMFMEQMGPVKAVIGHVFVSYYDVLMMEWNPRDTDPESAMSRFTDATEGLESELRAFGDRLQAEYRLKDAIPLLIEFEKLYGSGNSYVPTLKKFLPLATDVKNIVFNDKTDVVAKSQWAPLLGLVSRGYSTFLYYNYYVSKSGSREAETYHSLGKLGVRIKGLFEQVLGIKKTDGIPRDEVLKLVRHARTLNLVPPSIQQSTLNSVANAAMDRLMNPPERRLAGQWPNGIRRWNMDYILREMDIYLANQLFMLDAFKSSDQTTLHSAALMQRLNHRLRQPKLPPELKTGLQEMKHVLTTAIPFTLDSKNRLVISGSRPGTYNLRSVERHNMVRAMTRLLTSSYSGDLKRIRGYEGLNQPEVEVAFNDLKGAAVDMGWLDPKNTTFVASRYQEANIFMPRADGVGLASFNELHDLFFSISSGLELNSQLQKSLRRDCGSGSTVAYSCLFSSYSRAFSTTLASMPDFLKFRTQSTPDVFSEFFMNTMKGIGYHGGPDGRAPISYVALQPSLIQYIELIMTRFDINRDGVIVEREAKRAFPLFKDLLKVIVKKQLENGSLKESDLLALYCWILQFGSAPETTMDGLMFLSYKDDPTTWDVRADRAKIAQILGYIGEKLRAAQQP